MNHSDELRKIAKDIVKTEAGGLKNSQYWGLRLRWIAMKLDAKGASLSSIFTRPNKQKGAR